MLIILGKIPGNMVNVNPEQCQTECVHPQTSGVPGSTVPLTRNTSDLINHDMSISMHTYVRHGNVYGIRRLA